MNPEKTAFNLGLRDFLDSAPTPFHAVLELSKSLLAAGFTRLDESDDWSLEAPGKYFVTRNDSSIIAFVKGSQDPLEGGVRMVGAHTDSPCLMVKPQPDIYSNGYLQLGVEVYGGALLNPWFDRDLSIAGRIVLESDEGRLSQQLIDFKRPVAMIPSLAIHLDRDANKNHSINPQTDIPPILMRAEKDCNFKQLIEKTFVPAGARVVDYELCLYDVQRAAELGFDNEFFSSARLDNLLSCYIATQALINADGQHHCLMVCSDHEEVGSLSAIGADGPFLENVVARMLGTPVNHGRILNRSLLISCDNAHALHPNFKALHDGQHQPVLNGGPVIKVNVKQRYATNSLTSALFRKLCSDADIPVQTFVSRSDLGCGSTIGPITAARMGVPTLDVGVAQLAMHSCRETAGVEDPIRLARALQSFFNLSGSLSIASA